MELWCQIRVRDEDNGAEEIPWEWESPVAPCIGEGIIAEGFKYWVHSREWEYNDARRQMVLVLYCSKLEM